MVPHNPAEHLGATQALVNLNCRIRNCRKCRLSLTRENAITGEGKLGSRLMLLIIYLGGALGVNTWLIKGYFDTIPRDLDESALIDGASHAQIFFKVVLPLAAPILAVVALITFVFTINEFLVASVVLGQGDDENFTLAVGMFRFIDGQGGEWGQFAAGSVMAGIPVVLLFLFLQRYIVSGLTAGAVKG